MTFRTTSAGVPAIPRRRLAVRHVTRYQYETPVSHSTHLLHLRPTHDRLQAVLTHRLTVSPDVPVLEYDDPFGNHAVAFDLYRPYTELLITAESAVEVVDLDPFPYAPTDRRPFFPLAWQSWERDLLAPYLTPFLLPADQQFRLDEYAGSFAARNGNDVVATLLDLNRTVHLEYVYAPGVTDHWTTPYDMFTGRAGVCQDFSNLFVCLARSLGVPARYVCGYVHTPADPGRPTAAASHAWAQAYVPGLGWKSFDPTHGTIPRLDHIRVAHGRFPWDATPTAGVIFTPARERLTVAVEVRHLDDCGADAGMNGGSAGRRAA